MKTFLISTLLILSASAAFAGGGGSSSPVPRKDCNSGIDGNRDCRGDNANMPAEHAPPVVIPRTGSCPANVVYNLVSPKNTVDVVAIAESINDDGSARTSCNYKVISIRTSLGKVTEVTKLTLDGINRHAKSYVKFAVGDRKFNLAIDTLFEIRNLENVYDVIDREDAIAGTTYEVSDEYVSVPNTQFRD